MSIIMVINKTTWLFLVTDCEQVFEIYKHSYKFVHVINQINILKHGN
jgi:hypothetical protein